MPRSLRAAREAYNHRNAIQPIAVRRAPHKQSWVDNIDVTQSMVFHESINVIQPANQQELIRTVMAALHKLLIPPPPRTRELRVRLPTECHLCKNTHGIRIDQRRNDVTCILCGWTKYLHEGSFTTYAPPALRESCESGRAKPVCRTMQQIGAVACIASHTVMDACDLFIAHAYTHGYTHALGVACLLWVAHDLARTQSLRARFVPGLQADALTRARLPHKWALEDCEYDRWTETWLRTRFQCDQCGGIFSTHKERAHHAPCSLHRYEQPYLRVHRTVECVVKLETQILDHFGESTTQVKTKRDFFDELHIDDDYVNAHHFHRAMDQISSIRRTEGQDRTWERRIKPEYERFA